MFTTEQQVRWPDGGWVPVRFGPADAQERTR